MRSILKVIHVFVAMLVLCMGVQADIANSSFEEAEDADVFVCDRAASWGRWGHWINRETDWTPTHSGACLIAYHHWRIEDDDNSGIYQDVEYIVKGTEITFNIYGMKDSKTNVREVELRMEPIGGGEALASARYSMSDLSKSRWKLLTVTGVNATEGVRVLVVVTPSKGSKPRDGSLKFDDARLEYDQ